MSLSNVDLGSLLLETAGARTSISGFLKSEEARLTPGGAPRVLDEPVVGAVVITHTNEEDTVVKVGSARVSRHDTFLIELETKARSIDGNGNGSLLKESLELSGIVGRNISVGSGFNDTFLGELAATETPASIRVVRLKINGNVLGVVEGAVHKTTHAA